MQAILHQYHQYLMQQNYFQDLLVIELASVLAGPAVGMFFAELGARVIKIENKRTGGDVTRNWKGPKEEAEAPFSAYYASVNWGKESRLVDLTEEAAQREIAGLIRSADIVISNFKPASARRLGMAYEQLSDANPRLIYAELTAYGEATARPAFDVILQAEAGFMFMTGMPGGAPVKMPVALIDLLAAHQLKEGILLALLERESSGQGGLVRTSLLASAVAALANQAANWLMGGHIPQRMGSAHPNIAPYGDVFDTLDEKPLVIAAGTEQQFRALCRQLELEGLASQTDFATNAARVRRRASLYRHLAPAFRQRKRSEWLELLGAQGIPVGAIRNMQEVFEWPQARNMILEGALPDGRASRVVRTVAFEWLKRAKNTK